MGVAGVELAGTSVIVLAGGMGVVVGSVSVGGDFVGGRNIVGAGAGAQAGARKKISATVSRLGRSPKRGLVIRLI